MELTQVKGNTYVLEGEELIPLYLLGGGKCILLDTGLLKEREDLEHTLLEHGLTPAGILCSHAHIAHCASSRYFQEKYGAQVWLTPEEAGLCRSLLLLGDGSGIGHNLAAVNLNDALVEVLDKGVLVRDHQHGGAALVDGAEQIYDLVGKCRVDVAGRLVRDDHGGVIDKGARKAHTLAFAAGHFGGVMLCFVL